MSPGSKRFNISDTTLCSAITSSLLTIWKTKINCVITNNYDVGYTNTELTEQVDLLTDWILEKNTFPNSCKYMENLSDLQRLINRIKLKGYCS